MHQNNIYLFTFCLFLCSLAPAHGQVLRSAEEYNSRALERQRQGDLDGALRDFDAAIAASPTKPGFYYNRALAWEAKRDFKAAIADYGKAIANDHGFAPAYNNRGKLQRQLGDVEAAIKDYTQAIEIDANLLKPDPENEQLLKDLAGAYLNRGIARHDKEDSDGSISDLNLALKFNPEYSDAYNQRGIAWHDKSDLEAAMIDYTRAIDLDAKNAKAYINRGNVWNDKKAYDNAIADFNRALVIDPQDAFAYANRCVSQTKKQVFNDAINDCNKALALDPRFAEAYVFRGDLRADMDDLDSAIDDYSKAIKISPQYARAYLARGLARVDKGDSADAFADFAKAIELKASYAEAYAARGLALLSGGRDVEAERDLKKSVELNPKLKTVIEEIATDIRRRRKLAPTVDANGVLDATTEKKDIYSTNADAKKEIDEALKQAVTDKKRVLLVFGGNWCYDCHVLDRALHEGAAGEIVRESFLLVHVDIGEGDKNLDLVKKYKTTLDKGVPAVVILSADSSVLYSSNEGEFEAARKMMKQDLAAFLTHWKVTRR